MSELKNLRFEETFPLPFWGREKRLLQLYGPLLQAKLSDEDESSHALLWTMDDVISPCLCRDAFNE